MIELLNCYKSYDNERTYVLKDLTFSVKKGEIIGVVGKSGAGKTTLLNILGSLDYMNQGNYTFNNLNVEKMKSTELYNFRNQNIGFIFQDFYLIPYLTVIENILVPTMHFKKDYQKLKKDKAIKLLKEMDMLELVDRKAMYLSGGEKQRVGITRALINQPKLILTDEPTGNLDKENEQIILSELKRVNKDYKITMVIVSHNEEVLKLCDKIYLLEGGSLKLI